MSDGSIVILGFGPQPVNFFTTANKACGSGAIMDTDIARMAWASFAVGTPEALQLLRANIEPAARAHAISSNPLLSNAAAIWLASGERGMSSEAIFAKLTGVECTKPRNGDRDKRVHHPYDPADLRRCRLLLEQVPELEDRIDEMRFCSKEWAGLVGAWETICSTMDAESPDWRNPNSGASAPATYKLIQTAIGR